jgi:hypothetical protein
MELQGQGMRLLATPAPTPPPETWETVLMSVILFFMFAALISDRVAPDHVFMTALAFCMVTGIVTITEGLVGFSNEGVLTVMVRNAQGARCHFSATLVWNSKLFRFVIGFRCCLSWPTV